MHSNGEEGGGFSFGGDAYEYGWQLERIDDFSTSKCGGGKKVKNCSYVHLRSCSGSQEGNVLHSNMEEGAMLSYGGDDHGELGWRIIAAGDEGDKVRYGQTITLRCIADAHDGSDRGAYMHSNGEEGGGFSFGGDDATYGWTISPNSGWSSESS